ncbi:hypothetical protein D3C76_1375530 [compost metagenome]
MTTLVISELGYHAAHGYGQGEDVPSLAEVKRMGITFQRCMPDRMGDSIWLFGCRGVPDQLPEWLRMSDAVEQDFVGRILTQGQVDQINFDAKRYLRRAIFFKWLRLVLFMVCGFLFGAYQQGWLTAS